MSIRLRKKLKMDHTAETSENETITMFKFKRLRCSNTKFDNNKAKSAPEGSSADEPNKAETLVENSIFQVPKKRSGHRAVCDDENMWIWGGYCPVETNSDDETEESTGTSPMLSELYRYNFATKKWRLLKTTGESPGNSVASHSAILHKNLLIVFGGTGFPFGSNLSNSIHICNLKSLEWKKYKITGERPMGLYGSSLVLVGSYLYILFGTDSRRYCSNVYRVDIRTLESVKLFDSISLLEGANFSTLAQLAEQYPNDFLFGRYRQEVALHENKIYVFGGGKQDGNAYPMDELPVFNLATNSWEFIKTFPDAKNATFPQQRKFHSCIKIDSFAYIIGGMYCNLEQEVFEMVENCVWRLNFADLRWEQLNIEIPVATYFHASCSNSEGQVFVHGGIKSKRMTEQQRINHLYTVLFKIPKLSEMCWTTLVHNYPSILTSNRENLLDAGFPANFINRIN